MDISGFLKIFDYPLVIALFSCCYAFLAFYYYVRGKEELASKFLVLAHKFLSLAFIALGIAGFFCFILITNYLTLR